MSSRDGMNYAPTGKPKPVCSPGEFVFAAAGLEHGHIYGMCNGLLEAGGVLKWVYDEDPDKIAAFRKTYPGVREARSLEEILEDPEVHMVAAAAIPADRCGLGLRVLAAGKDYFTDKPPFTTLEQIHEARRACRDTQRKYMVYYSERLHSECAVFAGQLVREGAIGRVVQLIGAGPHRVNAPARPDWFFRKERYGGILCDIGCHQVEQFLYFAGCKDAKVVQSKVANYHHKQYPELEDFGDASLIGDNGATCYFRVDWLTPDGLGVWGDGRTIILGTEGYIELRKYIDVARDRRGNHLYLVDGKGARHLCVDGQVGYPFFGELILDCLNRTERAMSQEHAFKAAELSIQAQRMAIRIE